MFAFVALYSWPVVVMAFFRAWPRPVALILAVVAGYLFLPELPGLDLPLLPPLNKNTIPILTALVILPLVSQDDGALVRTGWLPAHLVPRVLIFMLLGGSILTALTNSAPLIYGTTVLQGLRPRDGASALLVTGATLLPLLLGRKLLAQPDQQRLLLVALAIAGCVYSVLALYEIRMSPQLNKIVYGFFPHNWLQHLRAGGFRPVVFLHHGLWLAVFFAVAILAAFGSARLFFGAKRGILFFAGLWLLLTLALSHSLGALVITLLLVPMVLFMGPRQQLFGAALISCVILAYPTLRSAGLVPVERIHEITRQIDPARAASLSFRLRNEDQILDKALQKPLLGWGGWGRNLVFSETGEALSVPDGYWVIAIGKGGWIQYIGEFGLLCLPLILGWYRARRYGLGLETSALALVASANLIDLVPNATITPVTWLIVGSLWGRLELGKIFEVNDTAPGGAPSPPHGPVYSRFSRGETPTAATTEAAERPSSRFTRQRPDAAGAQRRSRDRPR